MRDNASALHLLLTGDPALFSIVGLSDVVFVHAKAAEVKYLADGESLKRYPVMYNDFVLIGPKADPAGVKGSKDIRQALESIKDKRLPFISRGDRSGTHIAELAPPRCGCIPRGVCERP